MLLSRGPNCGDLLEKTAETDFLSGMILHEREKRLNMMKELLLERQKTKQLEEFIDQFMETEGFNINKYIELEAKSAEVKVGVYPQYIRKLKIKKYKMKQKKHRKLVKISRKFKGRSNAAKAKPRSNGRFAKYK
jgi:hypothetical protein